MNITIVDGDLQVTLAGPPVVEGLCITAGVAGSRDNFHTDELGGWATFDWTAELERAARKLLEGIRPQIYGSQSADPRT